MKLIILSLLTIIISSCSKTNRFEIEEFNSHLFSNDVNFVKSNLVCESEFLTDSIQTSGNEIYRCSSDNNNLFFSIVSNGNNSEDLSKVTLLWKNWNNVQTTKNSTKYASQFAAVMAKLYAKDQQIKLVNSFLNGETSKFYSASYNIFTFTKKHQFYTLHKAVIEFK